MLIMVCRFPRERRGPHEPDVDKPRGKDLLYDEAPVWFFNYNKAVMAYQPWLHGLQANPTEITHQYPEDIWVDATSPAK